MARTGRPVEASSRDAVARVIAGENISNVSAATGVSRSTIYRHLRALGLRAEPAKPAANG